ncbi:MAG: UvrD-helicase domain-containing protein, partial [Phycisphaeraceae bacterium]|nr:UvrD-helicase domain-containing protein [Phycisphaeraceae bacterium]
MTSSATLPHHVIRASAGSGKTYLLAVHYLRLLRDGADPGSILATTFTRKAAGEILHRVLGRLAAAVLDESCGEMRRLSEDLNKGLPARKHRPLDRQDCLRLLDKLCGQLHGLSIGTIDAFLSRVVSCYRHELGLAAGMTMISPGDPLDRQLRRRAIEAVLEGEQDVRTMLELLRRLHHDQASRSVTQALEDITSDLYDLYREAPEADVWQRLQPPPGLLPPVELQSHILNLGELVPRKWDSQMAKALAGDYHAAAAWDWEIFLQKGLAAKIAQDGADAKFYRKPIPPDLVDAYEPLIEHARADLIGRVAQRTSAMHDLLTRFDGHYLRLRREQGLLLFSDLTWLLGQAINPPPEDDNPSGMADAATMFSLDDLYYRLDSSVQHLLLDEFQDTSPSQWRVLRPLAQEIAAHGDGSRRLLCVGDVKQSIYGWRGGCAEIFSRVADDLNLPPESLGRLSLCWRSSPVVLRAVNKLFSDLPANAALTDHRDVTEAWIEGFEPHQAADPKRPGYVELCLAPAIESADHDAPDDDSVETIDHGYLGWVALRIAELARTAPTASIGVLLRRNAVAGALIHLLRQKGVEVSGEGGSTLLDDAGVNLILAGLRLADHPGDSAAAFHV